MKRRNLVPRPAPESALELMPPSEAPYGPPRQHGGGNIDALGPQGGLSQHPFGEERDLGQDGRHCIQTRYSEGRYCRCPQTSSVLSCLGKATI